MRCDCEFHCAFLMHIHSFFAAYSFACSWSPHAYAFFRNPGFPDNCMLFLPTIIPTTVLYCLLRHGMDLFKVANQKDHMVHYWTHEHAFAPLRIPSLRHNEPLAIPVIARGSSIFVSSFSSMITPHQPNTIRAMTNTMTNKTRLPKKSPWKKQHPGAAHSPECQNLA